MAKCSNCNQIMFGGIENENGSFCSEICSTSFSKKNSAKQEYSDTRECPFCAEIIKVKANKCKHCGEFLKDEIPQEEKKEILPPPLKKETIEEKQNKKAVIILASVFIVVALIVIIASMSKYGASVSDVVSDVAQTLPGSVINYSEYEQLQNGMSYEDCCKIIGEQGKETTRAGEGEYQFLYYMWQNSNSTNAVACFQAGKLISKSQVGLK